MACRLWLRSTPIDSVGWSWITIFHRPLRSCEQWWRRKSVRWHAKRQYTACCSPSTWFSSLGWDRQLWNAAICAPLRFRKSHWPVGNYLSSLLFIDIMHKKESSCPFPASSGKTYRRLWFSGSRGFLTCRPGRSSMIVNAWTCRWRNPKEEVGLFEGFWKINEGRLLSLRWWSSRKAWRSHLPFRARESSINLANLQKRRRSFWCLVYKERNRCSSYLRG